VTASREARYQVLFQRPSVAVPRENAGSVLGNVNTVTDLTLVPRCYPPPVTGVCDIYVVTYYAICRIAFMYI
jgi:hypothetical protein